MAMLNKQNKSITKLIEDDEYHTAEMKLKAFVSRYHQKSKLESAYILLSAFIEEISKKSDEVLETNSIAIENVSDLIFQNFEKSGNAPTEDMTNKLIDLHSKSDMNKRKIKYFEDFNKKFFEGKNDKILVFLIQGALNACMFGYCQRYLIGVDKLGFVIQLFEEWTKLGAPHEKDLFVIRFVLIKIAANKFEQAKKVYLFYKSRGWLKSNLSNMLSYLFRSIELESPEIFQRLAPTYSQSLKRDQDLGKLLTKIGQSYFGIQPQQNVNIFNMLNNLMGGM